MNKVILTSAVVSNVRLRAQTSLLGVANCITRTIAVRVAGHNADALDVRIGIGYRLVRTRTRVRTFGVRTYRSLPTDIGPIAFVYVCKGKL